MFQSSILSVTREIKRTLLRKFGKVFFDSPFILEPKRILNSNFFWTQNFLKPKFFFRPKILLDQNYFFQTHNFCLKFSLDPRFIKPFQAEHFRLKSCCLYFFVGRHFIIILCVWYIQHIMLYYSSFTNTNYVHSDIDQGLHINYDVILFWARF